MAIVHQTVVAECERCGKQSQPILPDQVDGWQAGHDRQVHEPKDREALLAQHGHVAKGIVEWFDQDDSSGYVTCSCGFRSRSMKVCWLDETIDSHLKQAQTELGLELVAPTPPPTPASAEPQRPQHRSRRSPLAEPERALG